MTEQIVFYTNPMTRGRIVHWMLEEVGAPYDMRVLSLEKGEQKTPQYLAINPMGKVPAIVHRGVVVTETAAICMYLADEFPAANLAPKIGDPQRGTYVRWFFFGAGCFEPAIVDKMLERPPAARKRRDGLRHLRRHREYPREGALAGALYPRGTLQCARRLFRISDSAIA